MTLGDDHRTAAVLTRCGEFNLKQNAPAKALRQLTRALEIVEGQRDRRCTARVRLQLGRAHAMLGDIATATDVLAAACSLFVELGNRPTRPTARSSWPTPMLSHQAEEMSTTLADTTSVIGQRTSSVSADIRWCERTSSCSAVPGPPVAMQERTRDRSSGFAASSHRSRSHSLSACSAARRETSGVEAYQCPPILPGGGPPGAGTRRPSRFCATRASMDEATASRHTAALASNASSARSSADSWCWYGPASSPRKLNVAR